jgi:hypothetical protein
VLAARIRAQELKYLARASIIKAIGGKRRHIDPVLFKAARDARSFEKLRLQSLRAIDSFRSAMLHEVTALPI